jgi:threonine synthase
MRHLADTILKPYNFERIAYYATGCNCALILEWMTVMGRTQQLTLETEWHERLKLDFCSARVTDDDMISALRRVHKRLNYIADPHTAVAMAAAMKVGRGFTEVAEEMMPVVILATASPCKFQEQMTVALGEDGWISWKEHNFPTKANETRLTKEIEPHYFPRTEGASLIEVQSNWRRLMLDIVNKYF